MPPEPPRRRGDITEVNESRAPHTPLPTAPTSPPPAMPMAPPKGFDGRPRIADRRDPDRTLQGLAPPSEKRPPVSNPPPPPSIRDSREVILAELALQEAQQAKAERDELRAELEEFKRDAATSDRKILTKLATRLGGPLVLLMGAATAWLTAHTSQVESKVDRVAENRERDKVVTEPLPEKVQTAETSAASCKQWAREYDDYNRQIWARFGVAIPRQPNALPSEVVEFSAPKAKSNRLNGGVILEVKTQPPALP